MKSSSPETAGLQPLDGAVVVDLSSGVAGQYAGRLLAMHGADVVLVEPPQGTPTRRMPPMPGPTGESFLFRHLNQGKRSVVVDRHSAGHAEVLVDLLRRADVVLCDQGSVPSSGISDATVVCEIGDFPRGGPYEGWKGTEMVHQALAGVMNMTGSIGQRPIYGLGHRSAYATGTTAYICVLAALHERRLSGQGQRIATTVFESVAAMGQNLVSQYSYNGTSETRARYPGFLAVVRCKDAWVVMFAIRNWPNLCRAFGLEDLIEDPRFAASGDRLANWPAVVELLQDRAQQMLADDVVASCQEGRVSAEKVSTLGDLIQSEHWRSRSLLREVAASDGGSSELALHRLFVMEGVDTGVASPSPRLGAGQRDDVGAARVPGRR